MTDDLRNISTQRLKIAETIVAGARILDFGVRARGGLSAGVRLANFCLGGLGSTEIGCGSLAGRPWPQVVVQTDHPLAACLLCQYAGWKVSVGDFFGMASGPMRSVAAAEEIFGEFNDPHTPREPLGVLEASTLPDAAVIAWLSEKLCIEPAQLTLCVARTASIAGGVQIVARSVETALHKLHELKFDVTRVGSGFGTAPLPPVAADDLTAIGRTNDAILYGGVVTLWVTGDDESIAEIGPQVPSSGSPSHGRPFLELFEAAGRQFYKLDPLLFSPAVVTFQNITTGRTQSFGTLAPEIVQRSFGIN